MRKSAFSALLFQIIGNTHVLLAAIKYPVFSAAKPDVDLSFSGAEQSASMLQTFMDAWEQEKETGEYKRRRLISEGRAKQQTHSKTTPLAKHDATLLGGTN